MRSGRITVNTVSPGATETETYREGKGKQSRHLPQEGPRQSTQIHQIRTGPASRVTTKIAHHQAVHVHAGSRYVTDEHQWDTAWLAASDRQPELAAADTRYRAAPATYVLTLPLEHRTLATTLLAAQAVQEAPDGGNRLSGAFCGAGGGPHSGP